MGVILPDRLLSASVVCVEAKTVSETSLHNLCGRSHAFLRFRFVLIGVSGDPQTDVQTGV